MATILDVNLLQSFAFVFVILLVWTAAFAILHKTAILGGDKAKAVNATVAAGIALLFLLSRTAIDIVNFMVPWFAVAIIFLFLMILIFMMFGADAKSIKGVISGEAGESLRWVIIGVGLLIIIAAFGNVLGQKFLVEGAPSVSGANVTVAGGDFEQNVQATLFHPKIIGLLVLFGVLIFAVALLTV